MSIDYDAIQRAGGIGKGMPKQIAKAKRTAKRVTRDEQESAKVRVRSKGQCEVHVAGARCPRRAFQVHHHLGGIGVRGRGDSALAKHKSHVCNQCHDDINAHTLQHVKGQMYRRKVT